MSTQEKRKILKKKLSLYQIKYNKFIKVTLKSQNKLKCLINLLK